MLKEFIKKIKLKLNPPIKQLTFPCTNCYILLSEAGCSELCDKVEMDDNKLTDKVLDMDHAVCPDCGGDKFFNGPSGGGSQNIKCATCKHKFNNCLPLFFERIGI